MQILAISGSARRQSTNTALLRTLSGLAPAGVDVPVLHDLHRLPVFSPDLEGDLTPTPVTDFMGRIARADGIVISSPEYVHAIPGGLKNAIDWMVSRDEIIGKPVALLHASHRGDDVLADLRRVLGTVTDRFEEAIFARIPLISLSPGEVAEVLRRPENADRLRAYLARFAEAIRRKA
ncbi:MAG: NADPH-dependent FMN reductase [Paracoccaceae bacterium]